jgi:hypothetical protein
LAVCGSGLQASASVKISRSAASMLLGLAVHATMCGPDLVSALANAVFRALIHVTLAPADKAFLIRQHS